MRHALLIGVAAALIAGAPATAQNSPLSALPPRGTVEGTDLIPCLPSGAPRLLACTVSDIAVAAGGGTVTSVGLTLPAPWSCAGSPVTTDGTISCSVGSVTANQVYAGPASGSAAAPGFRALTGADLPAPGASSLGGVEAFAAVSHQWLNAISTAGAPSASQPACEDLSDSGAFCAGTDPANLTGTASVDLFDGGTGASASTFLRGDGIWAPAGTGMVTSVVAGTGLSGGTITSSGTISLPASGVTAGTYSNATVTFDAEGRATCAENGAEEVPYAGALCSSSVPVTSTFGTTYNLGSLSLGNSASGIVVSGAPTASNSSLSLALEAAPSAPYTIYMRAASIQGSTGAGTYGGVGIALYDSSNGKSITIVPANTQGVDIASWTSTGSRNGNFIKYSFIDQVHWVGIYVTSTQVTFYVSSDGYVWYQYYGPYSFNSWPGATPDYVGIAIDNNYTGGSATIQCFSSSAPS